jgi:NAD(P)-dependent dehydrogenase (short-subunit alcohol dehydrogenase family)
MQAFLGKVAVVTGAASGIGLGMTEALASRGMKVIMADVEEAALMKEAERLTRANFEVDPQLADVSSYDSVERLAAAAKARFGKVHVLCNNAGVSGGGGKPIWAQSRADWDWVMGVNFWGVMNGVRAFVPGMIAHGEEGHVVNTSSILGLTTGAGSAYGVSKHAVTRLTEGLYQDLKAANARIGATVLCPGMIATNIITAERNRPEALKDDAAPDPARSQIIAAMDARFKADGMAPREVGEKVAEAIANDQFYVLTHPENMAGVTRRFEDIVNLRSPSPPVSLLGS